MYNILIIEDDEIAVDIYKHKLEAEGYRVETAEDGVTGFVKLRSFKPDLVLLDMMLPGLTGAEILASLRFHDEFRDLPIIAFSTSAEVLHEAELLGATHVLSKVECLPNQIVARITEILAALRKVDDSGAMFISTLADWAPPAGRVLVVEDDPIIMQLVKDVMEEEGYTVVSAEDGGKAYRILEKDNKFVAAIFDVQMPSLRGTDLLRYMQTEKRLMRIPVLIMTSEQSIATQLESIAAGAAIFLPKPFTRVTLRMMFRALISKKSKEFVTHSPAAKSSYDWTGVS
jgi:CheY-like chemotaxis protein